MSKPPILMHLQYWNAGVTKGSAVLLHGMGRTRWSMRKPAKALVEAGYHVVNLGYPSTSRHQGIHELAADFIPRAGVALYPAGLF